MKKFLFLFGIISLFITESIALAVTIGIEPPAGYMNNLKTCTKSYNKTTASTVDEYTIKGLLPDGRCEVILSNYTNFADPKVYEGFKTFGIGMAEAFSGKKIAPENIPTQAQMLEQAKKEKEITVCKFTREQRLALYKAYQKHDNKNSCITKPDGTQSCSFNTENMSSYDKLMMNYQSGTCSTKEIH